MIDDCTAIILAGGDSRRMGRDKANLLLGEQTLLQCVSATMQQVFPFVIVSVRQPRPEINLPQVCDEPANEGMPVRGGPLAGLVASLSRVTTPWTFVVACDMPFVEPAVVELLGRYRSKPPSVPPCQGGGGGGFFSPGSPPDKGAGGLGRPGGVWCQAVVPVVQGHPQPLAAFYAASCLAVMRESLLTQDKSLRGVLKRLDVCYVDEAEMLKADLRLRSFFDLDTPQDVVQALKIG